MAIFENPNWPTQPQKGVYGWFAQKEGIEAIPIYIGMAGKQKSFSPKGTLFRGISQLQRNTFSQKSPGCSCLDTDFIVGSAIIFLESKGYSCVWRHLSNEPGEELKLVNKWRPMLQDPRTAKLLDHLKAKKYEETYWDARKTPEGVKEAELAIFSVLELQFANISLNRTPLRSAG